MGQTTPTEFWLTLRTAYIDEDFERLKIYLRTCTDAQKTEGSYRDTLILLANRIDELNAKLSKQPLYTCDSEYEHKDKDRDRLVFDASLLAVYLLVKPEKDNAKESVAFLSFMNILSVLHPEYAKELTALAVKRLWYTKVDSLSLSWSDIDKLDQEVFVRNVLAHTKFSNPYTQPLVYSRLSGSACLFKEQMYLLPCPADKWKDFVDKDEEALKGKAENVLDTQAHITLRTKPLTKAQKGTLGDIDKMEPIVTNFIKQSQQEPALAPKRFLPAFEEGMETLVRITKIEGGEIFVRTLAPGYEVLEGLIEFPYKTSLHYYYNHQICADLKVGNYMKVTVLDPDEGTFSFKKQFTDFMLEEAKQQRGKGNFLAKLIDKKEDGMHVWMSDEGITVYVNKAAVAEFTRGSEGERAFEQGDFAILDITGFGKGLMYGKVYGRIEERTEDFFNDREECKYFIEDFVKQYEEEAKRYEKQQPKGGTTIPLDTQLLDLVIRLLFRSQQMVAGPTERFVLLSNAQVLAKLIDDKDAEDYLRFSLHYLKQIVHFVKGEDFQVEFDDASYEWMQEAAPQIHTNVLSLLKEYDTQGDTQTLSDIIEEYKERTPKISTLAKYILATNLLKDVEVDHARRMLVSKIMKTLAIEVELGDKEEGAQSFSYGVESGTQEFKTSLVYPPNNQMQADEAKQNRNVMKGICGFLNASQPGTLYLGVNDGGYISGLDDDIRYRKCETIDGYKRYINAVAKHLLGDKALPYLTIEDEQGGRVVAIQVKPYPFGVIKMEGEAYLRTNSETRKMSPELIEQVQAQKLQIDERKLSKIERLQRAKDRGLCVQLEKYTSYNTSEVSDRTVEVYEILGSEGLVHGYDTAGGKCRVFNIERVEGITILEKQPWKNKEKHKRLTVDALGISGDEPVRVRLHLDALAHSLLLEEYPMAKNSITKIDNGEEVYWHFEAEVYNLAAVARFYMGLANHIKIEKSPELEQHVIDFVRQHLPTLEHLPEA